MHFTAELRPSALTARPFKVVFKRDDDIVGEWPVADRRAGEERIAETLSALKRACPEEPVRVA